jgi:hypothetical protein
MAEEWSVDRDGSALDLIRPASEVAIAADGLRDIDTPGYAEWLPIIETFNLRESVRLSFDDVSQAI